MMRAPVGGGNRGLGPAFVAPDRRRNRDALDAPARHGIAATAIAGDVTGSQEPRRIVVEAARNLGGLDILVNDAGSGHHTPAADLTQRQWDKVFGLNVKAMFETCRAARPHLARRRGCIVNIGSMSGLIVNRPQSKAHYNASKAGVHHLTNPLAAEWRQDGIRVNALAPGYVKTELAPVDRPALRRHWIDDAPMRWCAAPEEIALSVVFLAAAAASFITGAVLVADGGHTAY